MLNNEDLSHILSTLMAVMVSNMGGTVLERADYFRSIANDLAEIEDRAESRMVH